MPVTEQGKSNLRNLCQYSHDAWYRPTDHDHALLVVMGYSESWPFTFDQLVCPFHTLLRR